MVFESLVVDLVNRFLGDFIENLDKSQLSIGLWGGDVVLNNLFVRENLMDEFDLPFKVLFGNIGQLKLKIPWKNLYTESTVALLDGLYIIAVPNASIAYNSAKEEKAAWDAKQKDLAKIEEAKKREAEKNLEKDPKQDSFAEKLVSNVIKNLELKITNIHIRYEDSYTDPSRPFTIGATLRELSCQTTDENWKVTVVKEAASLFYKLVKLDSLSLYWNVSPTNYLSLDRASIQATLKQNIVNEAKKTDYQYMVEPLTSNACMRMNMKPENDNFSLPKILVDVLFEEIVIALRKTQYQVLMEFLESFERMQLANKFRKYRQNIPYKGNAKQWWNFAYKCILEETVLRRRRMWSSDNIKGHRSLCREYRSLYKTKLLTNKPSADLLAKLEKCERTLDILNITMMRQQADVEARKESVEKKPSSWWGGWFGGSSKPSDADSKSTRDKFQELMTAEEKQKLYDAIGYQDNVDTVYPKEYVGMKLLVKLKKLGLKLINTDAAQNEVLHLQLQDVDADIAQRPGANGLRLKTSMKSMKVTGLEVDGKQTLPKIVSSLVSGQEPFFDVAFEMNPLDGECDTRIVVNARPIEVAYDGKTIISLADFFKPPEHVHVVQLQAAAMAKFQEVKQQTTSGLRYALQQHKFTEICVCLQPAHIVVPEGGVYKPESRLLILDLGKLSVRTEKPALRSSAPPGGDGEPPRKLSLDEMRKQAYDRFQISLESFELLFASAGEDWMKARGTVTDMHIIRPMSINIDIYKSIMFDVELPKIRVVGNLPDLNVYLTDQKLLDMLSLVVNLPLPKETPPPAQGEADISLKVPDLKYLPIKEEPESLVAKFQPGEGDSPAADSSQGKDKQTTAFYNETDVELKFEIKEICVALSQRKKDVDVPMIKVVIESLGTELKMCTYDMSITAYLGGIYLQHTQFKAFDELLAWYGNSGAHQALSNGPLVNLINTPIIDDQAFKLLTVHILMAQQRHPSFVTTYENTLQKIDVDFSALELLLHQECILNLMEFGQSIQDRMPKPKEDSGHSLGRAISTASLSSVSSTVRRAGPRRSRRKKDVLEVIDLALNARLDIISIGICTQKRLLTDIKIKGLVSKITLQKSKTDVSASLKDVVIFYHLPEALYPKILSFEGGQVFSANITIFNDATRGSNYLDKDCVDTKVALNTGCMKIVFLNKFVKDLLNFVNHFQAAKDKVSEAGSAVKDRAASAAQELSQKQPRISLDIRLDAPVVIIPKSSKSNDALVVDLGKLKVSNNFQILTRKDAKGLPAVLDSMVVELTSLRIFRALVMETEVRAECLMLEPVTLRLEVVRNLSSAWYHDHPDVDIRAVLQNFSILMSQGDLGTTFGILTDNLQEGDEVEVTVPVPEPSPAKDEAAAPVPSSTATALVVPGEVAKLEPAVPRPTDVYSNLKASLTLEAIQLELFTGDSDLSVGTSHRDGDNSLAKLKLAKIEVLANMKSDQSMEANVALQAIELFDSRPLKQKGITHTIAPTRTGGVTEDVEKMIKILFKQDSKLNKDIDMRVNSLHIVLNLEFLLRVSDFFIKGLPKTTPASPSPPPSPSKSPASPTMPPSTPVAETSDAELKLNFKLNKPEIVLVENAMNMDTNALFLRLDVNFLLRNSPELQTMKGSLKGLHIESSTFSAAPDATKSPILNPVDIDLHSSAPYGKNHHMEVLMSDIFLTISSESIRIITSAMASLSVPQDKEKDDELSKIPKELWAVKKIEDCDFWFLKADDDVSGAAALAKELAAIESGSDVKRDEQLILSQGRIIVTLLCGVDRRTIPLIITQLTLKNLDVRNWSSKLHVACELTLEMTYNNEKLSVWESLIEPVEAEDRHRPWELNVEVMSNELLGPEDDVDSDGSVPVLAAPKMIVTVVSNDVMQVTISKTSLDVFKSLGQSFSDAYHLVAIPAAEQEVIPPYLIRNCSGMTISIKVGDTFTGKPGAKTQIGSDGCVVLEASQSIELFNRVDEAKKRPLTGMDGLFNSVVDDQNRRLLLTVEDCAESRELRLTRAEQRAFSVQQRTSPGEPWQLVTQIETFFGYKTITLRSNVQVRNCLPLPIEIYYKLSDDASARCGHVEPGAICSLPCDAAYVSPNEIFFRPSNGSYVESNIGCKWRNLSAEENGFQMFECKGTKQDLPSVYISAKVEVENIFFESTNEATAKSYKIILNPTVVFKNLLPMSVQCSLEGSDKKFEVTAGEKMQMTSVKPGVTLISIKLNYQSKWWIAHHLVDAKPETLSVWNFETEENGQKVSMDLGLHADSSGGFLQLSLYSPYWMINKTQRNLSYKASDDYIVKHDATFNEAMFFLFRKSTSSSSKKKKDSKDNQSVGDVTVDCTEGTPKRPSPQRSSTSASANSVAAKSDGKKGSKHRSPINRNVKVSLRLEESEWSDKFSLDTVGSIGTVTCKVKGGDTQPKSSKESKRLAVGVKIALASTGLTKIVTFLPFYNIINQASFTVRYKEHAPNTEWFEVEPGECIPFWPSHSDSSKQLVASIKGTELETKPFDVSDSNITMLQLNHDYGGLNVEVQAVEGAITVIFQQYVTGYATVLLVNDTLNYALNYCQKDLKDQMQSLGPKQSVLYTWQDPVMKRELVWTCGEKKDNKDELIKDGFGDFFADSNSKLYWVSFLDGMQRVLLLTDDIAVVVRGQGAGELERVDMELNLCLQGFGLSLVNNLQCREIAYLGITSSGIIWEVMRRKRFKALKTKISRALEEGFHNYSLEVIANKAMPGRRSLEEKVEVDFSAKPVMMLFKPDKGQIRRSFEYGIWLQHRTSAHQTQIHLKIHRLQLDNQSTSAVFTTVLAPTPPPKSVAADSVPKPFAELSVMIRKSSHSNVKQFKYCKLLVQEMAVKVDQGFIGSMMVLFAPLEDDDMERLVAFKQDCELIGKTLKDDAIQLSTSDLKNFYDMLHFSPLKIHLSFSMYGAEEAQIGEKKSQFQFSVLSLFLQSIGVVLTDIQDIVFKLGYFERNYAFYSQSQLTSEISRHYTQQALKQMYVLVLGLDVLGNPFGVIRGLATGIEDLFYEPYQGAIQGPEEFAEGLALGVRSLLGNVVGGAAGAVSRITGTLGKTLATLTLDDEYQKKRREALNRPPADLREGLARGGKGLVMGVVDGITGIVTRPVEGAKQEGVGGFFKGLGKGIIGVVTRPVGGVVDFASSSFDGIRRVADMSDEVHRLRPARFIQADGILRPYVFREAEGNQILKDADRGIYMADHYLGHIYVSIDEPNIFLGTDKRIIFLSKGELLGQWNSEWSYTWNQLSEPPSITPKGIQVLLKEKQKKWFGSSSIGKTVSMLERDKKYTEAFIGRLRAAMTASMPLKS